MANHENIQSEAIQLKNINNNANKNMLHSFLIVGNVLNVSTNYISEIMLHKLESPFIFLQMVIEIWSMVSCYLYQSLSSK